MSRIDRFPSVLFLIAIVSLALPAPAAGTAEHQAFDELLEDFRSIRLASEGKSVTELEATVGHLTLHLRSGDVVPLETPSGEVLGFFFEGQGRYKYHSEDPADRQVIEANFTNRSKAGIYREYTLADRIERMVVYFAKPDLEVLWNGAGETVAVSPKLRGAFDKLWGRVQKTYLEVDHFAADVRLNGGDRQMLYAEIEGVQETVGYSYDTCRAYAEKMFLFRKLSGYDLRFQQRVSNQLIDGGVNEQPSMVRLTDVKLDLSTEDNHLARVVSDLTLEIGLNDVAVLPLSLLNNRDPDVYDWTSTENQLRVTRVSDAEGAELPYSHRYHELLVKLPQKMGQGQQVRLHVESEGEILTGITGDRRDNYFELFTDDWYPAPLMLWRDCEFTLDLTVQTKKPYKPVASGTLVSLGTEGDSYTLRSRDEKPVRWASVFAGKYKTHEETFDGLTIRIHGYAMASKRVMENMPKLAHGMIRFYEQLLGPYPFEELDIVEVPEYGFGIAPPGTVLITSEAYKARQDFISEYLSRGINARLAHEIAHQWFGHVAVPRSFRDQWISESFAEYLSGLAIAQMVGKKARVMGFEQMFDEWWKNTLYSRDAGPVSAANMLSGPNAFRERFYLLYSRGPLVLRMLHSMVGNERFYEILRRFLKDSDRHATTTEDFQRIVSAVSGTDMGWFFEDWVYTGGVPEIHVSHEIGTNGSGKKVITGNVVFAEGNAFKRMRVPLILEFKGANPEVRWIELAGSATPFEFEIPGRPSRVKVDPAKNFLAQFK